MQPKHRTPFSAPNTGLVGSLSVRTIFRTIDLLVIKSTVSEVKHRGDVLIKPSKKQSNAHHPMELKQGACVGEFVGRDCGCRVE
jgi:hypothetical protein